MAEPTILQKKNQIEEKVMNDLIKFFEFHKMGKIEFKGKLEKIDFQKKKPLKKSKFLIVLCFIMIFSIISAFLFRIGFFHENELKEQVYNNINNFVPIF